MGEFGSRHGPRSTIFLSCKGGRIHIDDREQVIWIWKTTMDRRTNIQLIKSFSCIAYSSSHPRLGDTSGVDVRRAALHTVDMCFSCTLPGILLSPSSFTLHLETGTC